jgi:hypothetical protein
MHLMKYRSWMLMPLFVVALPVGWKLGRPVTAANDGTHPESSAAVRERRSAREVPAQADYQALLRAQEAVEEAEARDDPDAFDKLLADWTDAEFSAALDEALVTPQCVAALGRSRHRVWKVFGAWMRTNAAAATAWIDTVRAAEMRDSFVREACRQWPADQALAGIEFLLAHHWRNGASYSERLTDRALSEAARAGGGDAVVALLERLQAAKIRVSAESLSFPVDFDFATLTRSEAFRTQTEGLLVERVMADWFSRKPASFLAEMRESGDWTHFNPTLRADATSGGESAMRLWEHADPEARREMLKAVDWSRLGESLDPLTHRKMVETGDLENRELKTALQLARKVADPAIREEWVEAWFARQSYNAPDLELLETLPDPARRVELLRRVYPDVDWRPDSPGKPYEAPRIGLLREAIRSWGVIVPPPPQPADPFAP